MEFCRDATISAPCPAVYRVFRDALEKVTADVENIHRVEPVGRESGPLGPVCRHTWYGQGFIPRVARPFLRPELLVLEDRIVWHDAGHRCQWLVQPRFFPRIGACRGELTFESVGPAVTRVEIRGDLTLTLRGLPLPRLARRAVAHQVERFFIGLVTPNLQAVAARVQAHLAMSHAA